MKAEEFEAARKQLRERMQYLGVSLSLLEQARTLKRHRFLPPKEINNQSLAPITQGQTR
jgi:hypothetical protein